MEPEWRHHFAPLSFRTTRRMPHKIAYRNLVLSYSFLLAAHQRGIIFVILFLWGWRGLVFFHFIIIYLISTVFCLLRCLVGNGGWFGSRGRVCVFVGSFVAVFFIVIVFYHIALFIYSFIFTYFIEVSIPSVCFLTLSISLFSCFVHFLPFSFSFFLLFTHIVILWVFCPFLFFLFLFTFLFYSFYLFSSFALWWKLICFSFSFVFCLSFSLITFPLPWISNFVLYFPFFLCFASFFKVVVVWSIKSFKFPLSVVYFIIFFTSFMVNGLSCYFSLPFPIFLFILPLLLTCFGVIKDFSICHLASFITLFIMVPCG